MKYMSLLHTQTWFYPLNFAEHVSDVSKKSCVHNIKVAQLGHLCHRLRKKAKATRLDLECV